MIVNAYLDIPKKEWEEIKKKYVTGYRVLGNARRKNRCCDDCGAYNPCTPCEGYCLEEEGLVEASGTCEDWHGL